MGCRDKGLSFEDQNGVRHARRRGVFTGCGDEEVRSGMALDALGVGGPGCRDKDPRSGTALDALSIVRSPRGAETMLQDAWRRMHSMRHRSTRRTMPGALNEVHDAK
jgi:hypothetical protein